MEYTAMGSANVPVLGFGTWQLTGDTCIKAVRFALDLGYRHIDTAQIYENETEVGAALKASGVDRSSLFVTTKLWTTHFKRQDVLSSTEESLRKLQMPYVDLLLIHWPSTEVPLRETLDAMQELIAQGKTRMIGISNFPVALMRDAVEACNAPIVNNQVEYHALLSQAPVLEYAKKHNIIITAYSPLARGKLLSNPVLTSIGEKYGKTSGQVALRWLISQPGVLAIPKAASIENAKRNIEIFDFKLTPQEQASIDALRGNGRIINPSFAPKWDAA